MEEHWDKFMHSGAISDYLEYKGIEMCMAIMRKYEEPGDGTGEEDSGADNVEGNGPFDPSYR